VRWLALLFLVPYGCASSGAAAPAAPKPADRPAMVRPAPSGPVTLRRQEMVQVVDAGLGRFLQKVDVEPSFANGRFQGFRIVELRPGSFWQSVDLQPGDVVLSVNGMPIERDKQAYDAFQTLRTARELRVDYLRDGQPRSLVYPISDP
jgi:general secretion pathway protein C